MGMGLQIAPVMELMLLEFSAAQLMVSRKK
jgi:hypothetical protein